jgi:hypothetical protein
MNSRLPARQEQPNTLPEETPLQAIVANYHLYVGACHALLAPTDVATIEGKEFKKRSAWTKLRRALNISIEMIQERDVQREDDWGVAFVVRATAPDGHSEDADGSCMASEFERGRLKATYHNVRAKALTRAKNRATADVLGAGEVSADEFSPQPSTPPAGSMEACAHWIERPEVRRRFWAWAQKDMQLTSAEIHSALRCDHIRNFSGSMSEAKAILENYAAQKQLEAHPATLPTTTLKAEPKAIYSWAREEFGYSKKDVLAALGTNESGLAQLSLPAVEAQLQKHFLDSALGNPQEGKKE